MATLSALFGALATLLAVVGLYGVLAYSVSRCTREIGLRMALGAAHTDVLRLVVREGMWLSLVGLVLGLAIALGLGLVLSKVLYGVPSADVSVLTGVTVLLLSVAALACYVPARRATRVDPLTALRTD